MNPYPGGLPRIESSRLRRHLESLTVVRHPVLNPLAIKRASQYITDQLAASGYKIRTESFYSLSSPLNRQHNLIATLPPATEEAGPERIIIGAHYDTVPFSPGADDNASGVAVLLEVAKACVEADEALRRPVDFIAFGMEEEGCIGSGHHAGSLSGAGTPVAGMVSLECVGYTDPRPGSQIIPPGLPIAVPDRGDFLGVIGNRPASALVTLMTESAGTHAPDLAAIGLVVEDNGHRLPATRLSDHAPFWDRGYPALMLTDTAFLRNPNYHRPSDLPETLDLEFMTGVTQAVTAFVLALAS